MFNQGGLSLDQAPPISVVLRFFITGALFGIVSGLTLLLSGEKALDASTPEALIMTHILVLGIMASFMLGALFQMLPVIAGVVIQTPTKKALFIQLSFLLGLFTLLGAFYTSNTILYLSAGILLGIALLYASTIMTINLFKLQNHSSSSKGILFALLSFTITVLLALYLVTALGGLHEGGKFLEMKEAHYSFGLFGWIALLIVSISFQVVEMFYVTPAYPKAITGYFTGSIVMLLILKTITLFSGDPFYIDLLISLLFITYAVVTIHRLYKRRRPTSDATVWFWRFGMGMLIITMLLFIVQHFLQIQTIIQLTYITFIFFALSVVFAMVYKIVPFLVWFHLSNQGYMKAPLMHDITHPKKVKVHFYLHTVLFVTWILYFIYPLIFQIASVLTIVSFGWLSYHLLYALYLYRYTQKHSEKISW